MMTIKHVASLVFAIVVSVATLEAASPSKFRAVGVADPEIGRYVITVRDTPEDIAVMKQEVAEVPETAPAPPSVASARHFAPRTLGYGDNGQSGTYTYDSFGNITAIGADTFLYDAEGRLKESVTRGVTETYTYDAFGNRKTATGATNCLGQSTCATPVTVETTTNHLLTTTNNGVTTDVTYDAAGNIRTANGGVYTYDGTGMMIQATVGSDDRQFVYTVDDERIAVRQGVSWTWTVRDPSAKVLREFTSIESTPGVPSSMTSRQWLKDYVWRAGLLLATTAPGGITYHYHLDHLGTPRLITDANHIKVAEHAYYPFGAEIALTPHETPEEAMKFTGHERDIVAGDGHTLDDMHARYCNPSVGRFLSIDPGPVDPGTPQSWNRYSYVRNNPMDLTDPDGRAEKPKLDNIHLVEVDRNDHLGLFLEAVGPATAATGSDLLKLGKEAIHYDAVSEAFAGFGDAPANEKAMAIAIGVIAVADVGVNAIAPEKAAVEAGATKAGAAVIGHFPGNKAAAEKIGAEFLNIANWTFGKNRGWLRDALRAGKDIFLSVDPSKIRPGSVTEKEVKYLAKRGFEFVKDAETGMWKAMRNAQ